MNLTSQQVHNRLVSYGADGVNTVDICAHADVQSPPCGGRSAPIGPSTMRPYDDHILCWQMFQADVSALAPRESWGKRVEELRAKQREAGKYPNLAREEI